MSRTEAVPITIGIATFRREEALVATLLQALALRPAPAEILVVDQTPEHLDETHARLSAWSRAGLIRWIQQDQPSLCRARNRVLSETRAEWVLFIDDDVIFESALLAHYWEPVNRHRVAACVGDVFQVPRFEPWMTEAGAIDRLPLHTLPGYTEADGARVDFLRGCNFLVHRETAIRVGGFDESLLGPSNGEEMDFALRLVDAGEPIQFLRAPWLIHLSAPSGGVPDQQQPTLRGVEEDVLPVAAAVPPRHAEPVCAEPVRRAHPALPGRDPRRGPAEEGRRRQPSPLDPRVERALSRGAARLQGLAAADPVALRASREARRAAGLIIDAAGAGSPSCSGISRARPAAGRSRRDPRTGRVSPCRG